MHRQNLDIEMILDKGINPNRIRPPTPIRKAPVKTIPNKQNYGSSNMYRQGINSGEDVGGGKGVMGIQCGGKKPLISPVRNPFKGGLDSIHGQNKKINRIQGRQSAQLQSQQELNQQRYCIKHPNKQAQFNIEVQDECLAYCGRCAAQLASQGFEVNRIQIQTVKKGQSRVGVDEVGVKNITKYPQYEGNAMYEVIAQFLGRLGEVESQHSQNMNRLSKMDENYTEQISYTKTFYQQLLTFIQQMRDDHLTDLYSQSKKHSQIADIQYDYLRQNVQEIKNIRNDIEDNLQIIVQKLNQDDLKNNLHYYQQKLFVYQHRVQEQIELFQEVIQFREEEYMGKLCRVQQFLMDVWKTSGEEGKNNQQLQEKVVQKLIPSQTKQLPFPKQHKQKQPTEYLIKGSNQLLVPKNHTASQNMKKVIDNENQSAFRRLFEEQQPVIVETSPQFKKI